MNAFPNCHVTCHHSVKHLMHPSYSPGIGKTVSLQGCCISELLQGLHDGVHTSVPDLGCKMGSRLHKQHLPVTNWPSMCSIDSVMQVGVRC